MPFDALAEHLLRAGIAPRHVRRYRRELEDHLADLTGAQREAGHDADAAAVRARALLGEDDELAKAMLARPELKGWATRAPWAVFGLLPPLIMMAAFFAFALPLVLVASLHGWMDHHEMAAPEWFRIWAGGTGGLANLLLGPGLAVLLLIAAERQRMNWKWPVLGIVVVAVAGFHMTAHFPPPEEHGGKIAIGVLAEFLGPPFPMEGPLWGLHMLLTFAPLLWLLRPAIAGPKPAR
jgi:hypothetical protein